MLVHDVAISGIPGDPKDYFMSNLPMANGLAVVKSLLAQTTLVMRCIHRISNKSAQDFTISKDEIRIAMQCLVALAH